MSYQPYAMPPPMPVDPTAVAGKRVGAWFIDAVLFVILSNVASLVFGTRENIGTRDFSGYADATQRAADYCQSWNAAHKGLCLNSGSSVTTVDQAYTGLWIFLALLVIFIVYQGLLGASLGKLAMGLRIVKADGSKAGIGASAVRTLLWVVDAITCGLPIVGGILILSAKGHRRVGDMAAGTYVIPAFMVGRPVILPGQAGWGTYGTSGMPGAYPGGSQGPYGAPGGYPGGPAAPPYGAPGPSGPPVVLPPGMTPWEPAQPDAPGGSGPASPPEPWSSPPTGSSPTPWAPTNPQAGSDVTPPMAGGAYEADQPIWDDARNAYIQYDSERAEWLEYDDAKKAWGPISR